MVEHSRAWKSHKFVAVYSGFLLDRQVSYCFPAVVVAGAMFNLSNRTAMAVKAIQRAAKGLATAAPRIGDTKVPMSLLEKGAYINYQRIEDNLAVVRERCIHL